MIYKCDCCTRECQCEKYDHTCICEVNIDDIISQLNIVFEHSTLGDIPIIIEQLKKLNPL